MIFQSSMGFPAGMDCRDFWKFDGSTGILWNNLPYAQVTSEKNSFTVGNEVMDAVADSHMGQLFIVYGQDCRRSLCWTLGLSCDRNKCNVNGYPLKVLL